MFETHSSITRPSAGLVDVDTPQVRGVELDRRQRILMS